MGQEADLQRLVGDRRLVAVGQPDVVLQCGADGIADTRVVLGHGCSTVLVLDSRTGWGGHAAGVPHPAGRMRLRGQVWWRRKTAAGSRCDRQGKPRGEEGQPVPGGLGTVGGDDEEADPACVQVARRRKRDLLSDLSEPRHLV